MKIHKTRITADKDPMLLDDTDTLQDDIDYVADTLEDIQDDVQDIDEDDVDIDTENNIADHYIAECDRCHAVFISAVMESDQDIDKISGICPICGKESDQYLRWVIKDVDRPVEFLDEGEV